MLRRWPQCRWCRWRGARALSTGRLLVRVWCWLAVPALLGAACGAPATAVPEAKEILRKALDLNEGVRDYTAWLQLTADLQGAPEQMPPFKVYFKRPDKVHIESRSLVVIRRDMLTFGNLYRFVEEGAEVLLAGSKTVSGTPMYTLKLIPKRPEAPGQPAVRVLITVDGRRWTVTTTRIFEGEKEQATFEWSYVLVGEKYWMPSTIRLTLPEVPRRDGAPGGQLVVRFSRYTVNTGLSDSLFEEPEG
jgi:outer membrane lipoprotein-sorting protein